MYKIRNKLRRLVTRFPPMRAVFDPRSSRVGFVVNSVIFWWAFSEHIFSSANSHSTSSSTFINHPILDTI
jgi:hypothetical protein